jgi:hypothetical protein
MLMAMGKLGKKGSSDDEYDDDAAPESGAAADDEGEEGDAEESADKKQAFLDMCKAIRAGKDEKAYELYLEACEGM